MVSPVPSGTTVLRESLRFFKKSFLWSSVCGPPRQWSPLFGTFFFLTITRSGLLVSIMWYFCIIISFIPVSSHSCWMYVRAGRSAFARPYVAVHKSTSLMSSSLLLQQCPACLVRLTWIVFVVRGRWPYSWCLVGCCRQDLFKIARSILV